MGVVGSVTHPAWYRSPLLLSQDNPTEPEMQHMPMVGQGIPCHHLKLNQLFSILMGQSPILRIFICYWSLCVPNQLCQLLFTLNQAFDPGLCCPPLLPYQQGEIRPISIPIFLWRCCFAPLQMAFNSYTAIMCLATFGLRELGIPLVPSLLEDWFKRPSVVKYWEMELIFIHVCIKFHVCSGQWARHKLI